MNFFLPPPIPASLRVSWSNTGCDDLRKDDDYVIDFGHFYITGFSRVLITNQLPSSNTTIYILFKS